MTTRTTVYLRIPEHGSKHGLRTHLENGFGTHLDSIVSAQVPTTGKKLDDGRTPAQCRYDKQTTTECLVGVLDSGYKALPPEARAAYRGLPAESRPNAVVVFTQAPRIALTQGYHAATCAALTLDYATKQGWPALVLDEFVRMSGIYGGIHNNFDRVSRHDTE